MVIQTCFDFVNGDTLTTFSMFENNCTNINETTVGTFHGGNPDT